MFCIFFQFCFIYIFFCIVCAFFHIYTHISKELEVEHERSGGFLLLVHHRTARLEFLLKISLKSIVNWLFRGRKGISNYIFDCVRAWSMETSKLLHACHWFSFLAERDVFYLFGEGYFLRTCSHSMRLDGSASEAFHYPCLLSIRFSAGGSNCWDWSILWSAFYSVSID